MTVEPFVFRGRLTEQDMVDIRRCCDRLTVRRSIRWLAVGFSTFLVAVMVLTIALNPSLRNDTSRGTHFVPGCFLVGWAYFIFIRPSERMWLVRRQYRRYADQFYETEVTLTSDRVVTQNEAHRSEYRWDLIKLVVDAPTGIMFCNAARQMHFWLPARLLESDDLREHVLALAESKGVPVARPR